MKVLITTSTFGESDPAAKGQLREAGFEIIDNPFKRKLTKDEVRSLLLGVDGLIAGLETLDRDVLAGAQLKVISRCGAGLSNVDLVAAKELGIIVRNTPLAPVTAVAELTMGCLLSLLRQIPQQSNDLHQMKWNKSTGRQLAGLVVAIVGFGNIGRRVAQLLAAFEAKVIAVDPAFSGLVEGFPVVAFNEALSSADVISLHASGEKCLIGENEFQLMKPGAYLLNAARGGLIDEQALMRYLDNKKIAGAWLDTFSAEPYTGQLTNYPQVILTPHIGSYTKECRRQMEAEAVNNLIVSLKGR
jgi:D-3-phosphoglycerate dehydrogenase / 2-oxoglutarate reductase